MFTIASLLLLLGGEMRAQDSYPAFYDAPKESYVKSMKTVFSDIRNRKWDKAQKDYAKVVDKSAAAQEKNAGYGNTQMQALFPLPQVAKAILLSTENSGVEAVTPDYAMAYSNLKQALLFPEKEKLNAFLSDPGVGVNLNMLEDKIENKLCQSATAANTEQAYDAVIDSLLPQSLSMETMKMQREALVFAIVSKSPTEAECTRYLEKYGDFQPSHKSIVSNDLDSIRYFALDGSDASLERYIKEYPYSSYTKRAKDTLETQAYREVGNTAASCRDFLEKYPSSKYTMEVKKKYESLAYTETLSAHTAAAYLQFCKDFPYDLHYQNIFDTLLYSTIKEVYDTVFAGKQPNVKKYLSSAFCTSVLNRDAADEKMLSDGLVPPRRKNIWTGLAQQSITSLIKETQKKDSVATDVTWTLDIKDVNMKSKTTATVHVIIARTGTGGEAAGTVARTGTAGEGAGTGATYQNEIYLDFIFENSTLKIDDIRLDKGASSQKNG